METSTPLPSPDHSDEEFEPSWMEDEEEELSGEDDKALYETQTSDLHPM